MTTKTCMIAASECLDNSDKKDLTKLIKMLEWEPVVSLSANPDVLLFAGGQDISPSLYGQKPLATTDKPNLYRDGCEIQAYMWSQLLVDRPVWKIGICRGMQLLNVLNGGKLQQHVDNHVDPTNGAVIHQLEYLGKNKQDTYGTFVNSHHHQMIIPPSNGKQKHNPYQILCQTLGVMNDPEAIYFPNTHSIGVQWHPEWAEDTDSGSFRMFKRIVDDYVTDLDELEKAA